MPGMRCYLPLLFAGLAPILCTCGNDGLVGQPPGAADSVVWFETPTITHDRDYHAFGSYVNAGFPTNWRYPIDYSSGLFTLRVEVVEMSNPAALPVYYTVGWKSGSGDAFTRVALLIDHGVGLYEHTGAIRGAEKVINGYTQGSIGSDWDWTNAWRDVAGDAWPSNGTVKLYPFKVRVRMSLHGTER